MIDHKKQGKANREAGKRFELKVREDLEKKGWTIFRNSNDVKWTSEPIINTYGQGEERSRAIGSIKKHYHSGLKKTFISTQSIGKFKQTTGHWNLFTKSIMVSQSGFPDFVCVRMMPAHEILITWEVQFVECKVNDYLSAEEKVKVEWIKQNLKIPVIIASRGKKRGEIEYKEPRDKRSPYNPP